MLPKANKGALFMIASMLFGNRTFCMLMHVNVVGWQVVRNQLKKGPANKSKSKTQSKEANSVVSKAELEGADETDEEPDAVSDSEGSEDDQDLTPTSRKAFKKQMSRWASLVDHSSSACCIESSGHCKLHVNNLG